MSHNQGARPKDQPGADKTLKPATRQQANASNKQNQNLNQSAKTPDQKKPGSSSGASGASASLPTKFDSSKAKPAVTPNKPDESTSNKRALSSPFDDSELNPMKKKIPENSHDSSYIVEEAIPEYETMDQSTYDTSTPTFHLAETDLQKIAIIVKLAIQEEVTESMRTMVKSEIKTSCEPLESEIKTLKTKVSTLEDDKSDLVNQVEDLLNRVDKLELERDTAEQYSRRNCVRISGIPVKTNEDTDGIILDMAAAMGSAISPPDIDRSHRIGNQRKDKTKDLIVKFATYRARDRFIRRRSSLKDIGAYDNVFINEDLTKQRSELLFNARKLQKDDNSRVSQAWSWDGRIFVKDSDDECHLISKKSDLDQLNVE